MVTKACKQEYKFYRLTSSHGTFNYLKFYAMQCYIKCVVCVIQDKTLLMAIIYNWKQI